VQECRQTTIELTRVADFSRGGVEHSLQLIYDRLRSSCIDGVAIGLIIQSVTSRKHAQKLLPILHRATAECDEVGAASRSQEHRSSKRVSRRSDPTKWSVRVLAHDRWRSQLSETSCWAEAQLPTGPDSVKTGVRGIMLKHIRSFLGCLDDEIK